MRWIAFLVCFWASGLSADPAALAAVNAERAERGRVALAWNAALEEAALAHAADMARRGYFSHTGANGSSVRSRVTRTGYDGCFWAENIAKGQRDVGAVLSAWMGSRGHRANILHRNAREVGLARAGQNIWVMVLAAPC